MHTLTGEALGDGTDWGGGRKDYVLVLAPGAPRASWIVQLLGRLVPKTELVTAFLSRTSQGHLERIGKQRVFQNKKYRNR